MSKQVWVNGETTNSLGVSPIFRNKVIMQQQPRREQTWGSGVWQLEMGLVQTKEVPHGDRWDWTQQVPSIWV